MTVDSAVNAASSKELTPEVLWAQRSSKTDVSKNFIYLTIMAADVPNGAMKLDLQPKTITFTGHSDSKKATYHLELELYDEIDPSESHVNHTTRDVVVKLHKKELKEAFWPRLLKDPKKAHFLKTDFDKWVDEDEQEDAPADDMMNGMGGMGDMGGMGGDGGFGNLDFSKLGGGGGGGMDMSALQGMMSGAGGGIGGMDGMEGDDGEGDTGDDSDDDMPELEDQVGAEKKESSDPVEKMPATTGATEASTTKTSAKIEEVE